MPNNRDDSPPDQEVFDMLEDLKTGQKEVIKDAQASEERVRTNHKFVAELIDISGLTPDQIKAVASYSHYDPNKQYDAQTLEQEASRLQFMADFLQHPEKFKPSRTAYAAIYADYIAKTLGERVWTRQVTDKQIEWALDNNLIRDVKISVGYKRPNQQSFGGCVKTLSAKVNLGKLEELKEQGADFNSFFNKDDKEVMSRVTGKPWSEIEAEAQKEIRQSRIKNANDKWQYVESGGIAFYLPDWIERVE
jgi:hypothetical protein